MRAADLTPGETVVFFRPWSSWGPVKATVLATSVAKDAQAVVYDGTTYELPEARYGSTAFLLHPEGKPSVVVLDTCRPVVDTWAQAAIVSASHARALAVARARRTGEALALLDAGVEREAVRLCPSRSGVSGQLDPALVAGRWRRAELVDRDTLRLADGSTVAVRDVPPWRLWAAAGIERHEAEAEHKGAVSATLGIPDDALVVDDADVVSLKLSPTELVALLRRAQADPSWCDEVAAWAEHG